MKIDKTVENFCFFHIKIKMPFSNKDYFLLKCSRLWVFFLNYVQIFLTAMPIKKKKRMFKNKYRLKVILTKTFVKKITEIDKKNNYVCW